MASTKASQGQKAKAMPKADISFTTMANKGQRHTQARQACKKKASTKDIQNHSSCIWLALAHVFLEQSKLVGSYPCLLLTKVVESMLAKG